MIVHLFLFILFCLIFLQHFQGPGSKPLMHMFTRMLILNGTTDHSISPPSTNTQTIHTVTHNTISHNTQHNSAVKHKHSAHTSPKNHINYNIINSNQNNSSTQTLLTNLLYQQCMLSTGWWPAQSFFVLQPNNTKNQIMETPVMHYYKKVKNLPYIDRIPLAVIDFFHTGIPLPDTPPK